MLVELVRRHSALVASWRMLEFDHDGPNYRLRAEIEFSNGSVLHIRQVVLEQGVFKYAYHWRQAGGELICRWDNARHWPDVPTYPHHKHQVEAGGQRVKPSCGGDLDEILAQIAEKLK